MSRQNKMSKQTVDLSVRLAVALIALLMIGIILAGCTSGKDKIADIEYTGERPPALPGRYKRPCILPPIRAGEPLRVVVAKRTEAVKACEAKRAGYVDFYDQMRASYPAAGQPKKKLK